jgi:ketosteroid isomerase-like protein
MTPEPLRARTLEFTEAFNRGDLDRVMAFFVEDAIYDQVDGTRNAGRAAIRAAFEPQFRGDFGAIRFDADDVFVDAGASKALVRWTCVIERDGRVRSWRGLDVLHFRGGLVVEKHTYGKAERLRLETKAITDAAGEGGKP